MKKPNPKSLLKESINDLISYNIKNGTSKYADILNALKSIKYGTEYEDVEHELRWNEKQDYQLKQNNELDNA